MPSIDEWTDLVYNIYVMEGLTGRKSLLRTGQNGWYVCQTLDLTLSDKY